MKTKSWIALFLLIGMVCCKDDPAKTKQTDIIEKVSSGTWRITYFYDSNTDKTSGFTAYTFTFSQANVLKATNGTNNYAGAWSVTDSNSNDDTLSDLHFNITFTTPPSFVELTNEWEITEYTDVKLKLTDVSGGGGGTDYLTFEKN